MEMSEEGKNKLTFQNLHKQLPAPYIIYTDFKEQTTKIEGPEPEVFQITAQYEPIKERLLRKSPYEYIGYRVLRSSSSYQRLGFIYKLSGEPTSDEDYTHAQCVWETASCHTH